MQWRTPRGLLLAFAVAALVSGQQDTREEKSARAAHAMAEDRFADAEKLYAELARSEPANTGVRLSLGIAQQSQGKYREALEQFRAVVEQTPASLPAWLLLGLCQRSLNQPGGAIPAFERVLALEPHNRTALAELAEALFALSRYAESAQRFYELTEIEPSNPRAWQGLGQCYLRLARQSEAELEKKEPGSARWFVLRARERSGQGKDAQAFALYRHALALDPSLRGVHTELAGIYLDHQKPEWAAEEEKREAALPQPDCTKETLECEFQSQHYWQLAEAAREQTTTQAIYWRSLAYRQLAEIAFARMAELPLSAELLERKADTLEALGRPGEAVQVWQEALDLAPTDTRLQTGLARSLCGAGQWINARALLNQLLQKTPDSAELLGLMGEAMVELGDRDSAIVNLGRAGRKDAWLARAYLETGQPARAAELLKQPGLDRDGKLHKLLADCYTKSGQVALARQAAARAGVLAGSPTAKASEIEGRAEITAP